jgi:hypothetical protein
MWKHVSYEVQGVNHVNSNVPCQDKTYTCFQNGVYIIALADGAGSAKFSHFGADCVVHSISEFISFNFNNLIKITDGKRVKIDIIDCLLQNLNIIAEKQKCDLSDLATTLL